MGLSPNPIFTDLKTELSSSPSSPTHTEEPTTASTVGDDNFCETSDNNSTSASKTDQVKTLLLKGIDEKTRKKINTILSEVSSLSDIEKLLLYMQMPTTSGDSSQGSFSTINAEDSTSTGGHQHHQSPLTPGGSATNRLKSPGAGVSGAGKKAELEVAQTYAWIKTHLEEDAAFSLPKQEVYDDYRTFCQASKFDALCVADFGKAMKQVFPSVKPRRLGQRGNSKYCYSGLKKRFVVETNPIPSLDLTSSVTNDECSLERFLSSVSSTDILNMIRHEKSTCDGDNSSSTLNGNSGIDQPLRTIFDMILKWIETVSNHKFPSIRDFLFYVLKGQPSVLSSSSSVCPTVTSLVNGVTPARKMSVFTNNLNHAANRKNHSLIRSNSTSGYRIPCSSASTLNYVSSQNLEKSSSSNCFESHVPSSRPSRSRSMVEASLAVKQEYQHNYLASSARHDLSLNSSCDSRDIRDVMSAPHHPQSVLQKYKSIQPKAGDSMISSAPATASSSPTQTLRFDGVSNNKRKLSTDTPFNGINNDLSFGMSSSNASSSLNGSSSCQELFVNHPRKEENCREGRKKLCLASIQSSGLQDNNSNRLKSMSSSGSFTSTDSGIQTPGSCTTSASFPVTVNDSLTSRVNLFECSGLRGEHEGTLPASTSYVSPEKSRPNNSDRRGLFSTQENTDHNPDPTAALVCTDSSPQDKLGITFADESDGVFTKSYSRPSSSCIDNNSVVLENKSNLDRHQLSQLRKLLEQNLPASHRMMTGTGLLKESNSLPEGDASSMTSQVARLASDGAGSRCTTQGTLNSTLPSGLLHESPLYGDSMYDTTSCSLNNVSGNTAFQVPNSTSLCNGVSLANSPVIQSQRGSPMNPTEIQGLNDRSTDPQGQRYTFQPICHSSNHSPSSLLSETTFLNESPPLTTSITVATTNGTNSPNSRSPPQTPFISESRSRNDSGHSLHSSFETNSTFFASNGQRLDSGLSSVSGSPFVSPHGTPIPMTQNRNRSGSGPALPQTTSHANNRSRHSSGPGHYSQTSRTPVMRANSYSPLASYPHHTMEGMNSAVYRPQRDPRFLGYNGIHQLETVPEMQVCESMTKKNNRSRHYSTPFGVNCNPALNHLQVERSLSPSINPSVANFMRSNSVPVFENSSNETSARRSTLLWSDSDDLRSYPNTPTSGVASLTDILPSNHNNCDEDTKPNAWSDGKMRGQRNLTSLLSLPSSSLDEDQDLQTTLDDLKDCDNDFSRFAQELEEQEEDPSLEDINTFPSSDCSSSLQIDLGITH
jgi:hypothetical protein